MNNVSLVGRLTKDVELTYTPSGVAVAKFGLAVNRAFKKDETDFINCTAFNKQAENLANYMSKGSQIGLVGRIQTGSYEKDGKRVYTTDVIADNIQFLESKKDTQTQTQNNYARNELDPFSNKLGHIEISDDEMPF